MNATLKFRIGLLLFTLIVVIPAPAQPASPDAGPVLSPQEIAQLPFRAIEHGPHHRVMIATDNGGKVVSQYTELLTSGFKQLEDGTWAECDTEVELFEGGAVARKTRYQA